MSDLISRNKLLESFRKSYCGHLGMENSDVMITFRSICRIINEQPTAYDIYKVVKELEELADNSNDHMYESYFDGKEDGIREVIEIVKQGVVDDDVCEWKKGSSGYVGYHAYYSKCCTTNSKGLEMQTHIIADWKYCPYCGKKIKESDKYNYNAKYGIESRKDD